MAAEWAVYPAAAVSLYFLTVHLLHRYWTDLHQIFSIGRHMGRDN